MADAKQTELDRAVSMISTAYANGRIDALELAAEMERIGRLARGAASEVDGFGSSSERIEGELDHRASLGERGLLYHQNFLDDVLRCIVPHDFILIGADTGAGKTDLATSIARENARRGKHVYYFALEAEPKEIERRIKFSVLSEIVDRYALPRREYLNYPDWYLGMCEGIVGRFNAEADDVIRTKLSTLHTYYRDEKFDRDDIRRLFCAVQDRADLIILDHLHYVDLDDENENRGYKALVQLIRDLVLGAGKPVIAVAHLRKRDMRHRRIVPDQEDFHGSSDIIKVCTRAIMLSPARSMPSSNPMASNTFIYVPKDRVGGATGLVALQEFHRGMRCYSKHYRLGRPSVDGTEWEELAANERPRWARRCV